jgi:GTP-binding protein HflX
MTELAELIIPWDRGDVLASVHREGQVLSESAEEHGMRLKARLEPASLGALREYLVEPSQAPSDPETP